MEVPDSMGCQNQGGSGCKLHNSFYRERQAQRLWNEKRNIVWVSNWNFEECQCDLCLNMKYNKAGNILVIIAHYVGDSQIGGNELESDHWMNRGLNKRFGVRDLCEAKIYLSMEIIRGRGWRMPLLSQEHNIS